MSRRGTTALLVVLLLTLAAPTAAAQALLVSDTARLEGTIQIAGPGVGRDDFLLLSGALAYDAEVRGAIFGMQTEADTRIRADRVRVYDVHDPFAIAADRPVLDVAGAELRTDPGTSFFWSLPRANVSTDSAYSFAFLVPLERDLNDTGLLPPRNGPPPLSLVAQAREPWQVTAAHAEPSTLLPTSGRLILAGPDGLEEDFSGDDWLLVLDGNTTATILANGIGVPFETGHSVRLTPADPAVFADRFSVDTLQSFLGTALRLHERFQPPSIPSRDPEAFCTQNPAACGNGTLAGSGTNRTSNETDEPPPTDPPMDVLPPEATQALASVAPLLNGAFFGQVRGHFDVGTAATDHPGFSLVRYTGLTLRASDHETVQLEATSPFAFTGGDVHHDASVLRAGPLVVPVLSLFLYLIAIGAWIGVRMAPLRAPDPERTTRLAVPAVITQWGLLLLAFLLFDREVHYVLGQSLLGSIGIYGTPAAVLAVAGNGLVVLIQLGLWAAASVAFGVPIALLGRSALKAFGLGRATYGFAIGLGALATWLLGSSIILPLLDVAFGAIAGNGA